MYFKDLVDKYGMSFEAMNEIGDMAVWEFIIEKQGEEGC